MRQVAAGHDGRSGATIAAVILLHPVLSASTQDLARGAGYDIVLLAHVLSVVVGFGAVAAAGGYALALARSGPESESIRRYYQPGINWAGRVLFLVPIFGIVLLHMSHGQYGVLGPVGGHRTGLVGGGGDDRGAGPVAGRTTPADGSGGLRGRSPICVHRAYGWRGWRPRSWSC